jgi:carbon-monoxide dehydrogenase large subunit
MHLPGPYVWEAFEIESVGVTTNRTPVGTYRGPGATEATFVRERMLDAVARELGISPVELRRRNLVPGDAMPFVYDFGPEAPPLVYETGDYRAFFEHLLAESGYEELRSQPGVGVGVAAFVEVGGVGPFEHAWIVPEDGRYCVRVGIASVGQGVETVLAQIAADELGVPLDEVCVEHHDTDEVPEGFGAFASRSTVLAGNAIVAAARDLREKAARELAGAAAELAAAGIRGEGTFEKENPSFSFGANLSVVSVDEATGRVTPLRHVVAFDVGRAINPALVRGQLAGAAAQGIAGALFEELVYDEDGYPLTTSFLDYQMPTAAELPPVEVLAIEHPTPTNPLGIKGAGEAGMNGAPAAVANAVADALSPTEDVVDSLPLSAAAVHALLTARGS